MRITELDDRLQGILNQLGHHPKITVACGSRDVILYVQGAATKKMVESRIPSEYRETVSIVSVGRIRPASRKPR